MVQAYSIGTSKRKDIIKSDTPGPGTYQADKMAKKAIPKWKIGTEQRPEWGNKENPGPGNYEAQVKFLSKSDRSPTYQFGIKYKSLEKKDNLPGPGSYNPQFTQENLPKYSIRPKTTYEDTLLLKKKKDPGPGFYETNKSTILNQPSSKIGNSQRTTFAIRSLSPGPGSYMDIKYKTDMPQYGFGSENRQDPIQQSSSTGKMKNLGPGCYNLKSTLKTNIGPALTPRRENKLDLPNQNIPGPGTYEQKVDFIKKSDPKYKIGTDKLRVVFDTRNYIQIGPGQYSPKLDRVKNQSPNYRFGSSKRINFEAGSKTPGAGTYEIPSKIIEGPKYIMNPRREDEYLRKDQIQSPSPNKYNINLKLTKENHSSIGIGSSKRPQMGYTSYSPGPGNYLKNNQSQLEGPLYSFGKQYRQDLQNNNKNPGPGSYQLKSTFADVPKYLIPDKNNSIQKQSKSLSPKK